MQTREPTILPSRNASSSRHAGAPTPAPVAAATGPGSRAYVCLGCGAPMIEIGCKIRCRACGYFEDCGGGLTPPPVDGQRA